MMRFTYAKAGVDIQKVKRIHGDIDRLFFKTFSTRKGKFGRVLDIRQHYAGLIDIGSGQALALHSDGVGTKVLVALMVRKYEDIGIDCVAMNVNDLICLGAEPIALVDSLALEKPNQKLVKSLMKGLYRGALEAGVAIVSGETAIMPDVINGFDLSAASIGVVRKDRIIEGTEVEVGDSIIGLPSTGIHSNGLTLARKVLLKNFNRQIAEILLTPTRIYVKPIMELLRSGVKVHGMAHITGGAYSKLKRIGGRAKVGFHLDNLFKPQRVFELIQKQGKITDREMYRTFNMGTGFLVMIPSSDEKKTLRTLNGSRIVGRVVQKRRVIIETDSRTLEIERW
jgi:phosphoribosylformylglycinamidine cyclo-ligase